MPSSTSTRPPSTPGHRGHQPGAGPPVSGRPARGGPTRLVPLDLADRLGVPYPATSPGLLASFVVILRTTQLTTGPDAPASSTTAFGVRGTADVEPCPHPPDRPGAAGRRVTSRPCRPAAPPSTTPIGRCRCPPLPGDRRSPAPLSRGRPRPKPIRPHPVRRDGRPGPAWPRWRATLSGSRRSRISVLLANTATPQTLTVTHTLWAMLGVLPVGRVQRPHRHQSVALDLITRLRPGVLLAHRIAPRRRREDRRP